MQFCSVEKYSDVVLITVQELVKKPASLAFFEPTVSFPPRFSTYTLLASRTLLMLRTLLLPIRLLILQHL